MSQTGPQYHRGGQPRSGAEGPTESAPIPPAPAMPPMTPGYPADVPRADAVQAETGTQPNGSAPLPATEWTQPVEEPLSQTGSQRARAGESYGYDYRYSEGMDDGFVRTNGLGWLALAVSVVGAIMTWDRLGAFVALPLLFLAFLFGLIALSLSGRRKWYAWLAVIISTLAGCAALVSVLVTLIALMGGLDYSGSADVLGVFRLTPLHISGIDAITFSFPDAGLSFLHVK